MIGVVAMIFGALGWLAPPGKFIGEDSVAEALVRKRLPDLQFKDVSQDAGQLKETFDYQLKSYTGTLETFSTNLFAQAALIVFAIYMMYGKGDSFQVPVLNLTLKRDWLYFVVPAALLFLWLRFGFLLDTLIKCRLFGWELLRQMAETQSVSYSQFRANASLFEDSGFIDGWFVCYRQTSEHLIALDHQWLVKFIFPGLFATLLGANHACILAIPHIGLARLKREKLGDHPRLQKLLSFSGPILAVFLFASHGLFAYGGQHPNWFQAVMTVLALIGIFGMIAFARGKGNQASSGELMP